MSNRSKCNNYDNFFYYITKKKIKESTCLFQVLSFILIQTEINGCIEDDHKHLLLRCTPE